MTRRRIAWSLLVLALALVGAALYDPLNRVQLAALRSPMYYSGMYSIVPAPADASMVDVLRASHYFSSDLRVIETRMMLGTHHTGVWVRDAKGNRVALVSYSESIKGWEVSVRDP